MRLLRGLVVALPVIQGPVTIRTRCFSVPVPMLRVRVRIIPVPVRIIRVRAVAIIPVPVAAILVEAAAMAVAQATVGRARFFRLQGLEVPAMCEYTR